MTIRQYQGFDRGRNNQPLAGLFLIAFMTSRVLVASPESITLPAGSSAKEIQQALDEAPAGVEILLAPGKYDIHQPIILNRDGLVLRGSGPETVLRLADRANCPVLVLGAPFDSPTRKTSWVQVSDLTIDGNRAHQQVELWRTATDGSLVNNNGIVVWNADHAEVQRVVTYGCRSGGLVTSAGTRRLTVYDLTAYDNQYDGLACYLTEGSRFTKLLLHDNLGAGISLDLAFNQNAIEDAQLTGNDLGIFMRHSRDNTFRGLSIRNSRHHGVFIAQAGGRSAGVWEFYPGTECTGNRFLRLDVSDSGGKAFLINDASCTNNVVTDGRFARNAGDEPVLAEKRTVPVQ